MTIKKMWEGYKAQYIHPKASEIQLKETRYAFYAGVIAMMEINKAIGDSRVSEKRAINYLNQLERELETFRKEVTQDAAFKRQTS